MSTLVLASLIAASVTQTGFPEPKDVEGYRVEQGADSLELKGVCDLNGEAKCWAPDGSPAPDLQKDIVDALRQRRAITTLYGKKTVHLVFLRTQNLAGISGIRIPYYADAQGNSGSITGLMLSGGVRCELVPAPAGDDGYAVTAAFGSRDLWTIGAPMKKGAKVEDSGRSLQVQDVRWTKAKSNPMGGKILGSCKVKLSLQGSGEAGISRRSSYRLLDSHGKPIEYTDGYGKPTIPPEGYVFGRPYVGAPGEKPRTWVPVIAGWSSGANESEVTFHVDPKYVGRVEVVHQEAINWRFKNIALQPKSAH